MSVVKIVPVLLGVLSLSLQAEGQESSDNGFLIGGGVFSAANSSCDYSDCAYSGQYGEIGYDFNNVFGIEAKYVVGENDSDIDLTVSYFGLNIGHDFNTEWFRLYGKVGYANIKEEESGESFCNNYWCYYPQSYSSSGATFGIGTRFTFSGKASGLYLKLESLAVAFENDTVGAAFAAGLGYRF